MSITSTVILTLWVIAYIPALFKTACLLFLNKCYCVKDTDSNNYLYIYKDECYVYTKHMFKVFNEGILVYFKDPSKGLVFSDAGNDLTLKLPLAISAVTALCMMLSVNNYMWYFILFVVDNILRKAISIFYEYHTMLMFAKTELTEQEAFISMSILYIRPWYLEWWFAPIQYFLFTLFFLGLFFLYYDADYATTQATFNSVMNCEFPALCPKALKELYIVVNKIKSNIIVHSTELQFTLRNAMLALMQMLYTLVYPHCITSKNYILWRIFDNKSEIGGDSNGYR